MDFIRTQDYIHTDLSWNVTGLLKDMRSKGTKIYFDFSKRYRHEDVPTILKNINYGIFSFEEETEEVRELLRMGCSMGAEVLLATFGEGGSLAFDGTEFYRQPCIPAPKLVNTVGAGDSYGAGFMSGILRAGAYRNVCFPARKRLLRLSVYLNLIMCKGSFGEKGVVVS